MPSERVDQATIDEWRELGFFYVRNDDAKEWRLVGSRAGLLNFCALLSAYVADPRNDERGEHDQYKPYYYLEFMTWPEPGLDDHSIHGPLSDLERLASIVESSLAASEPGAELTIRDEYAPLSPYSLVLDVREDDFDPASADPQLPERLL